MGWVMWFGLAMRPRFAPAMCVGRETETSAMQDIF